MHFSEFNSSVADMKNSVKVGRFVIFCATVSFIGFTTSFTGPAAETSFRGLKAFTLGKILLFQVFTPGQQFVDI